MLIFGLRVQNAQALEVTWSPPEPGSCVQPSSVGSCIIHSVPGCKSGRTSNQPHPERAPVSWS